MVVNKELRRFWPIHSDKEARWGDFLEPWLPSVSESAESAESAEARGQKPRLQAVHLGGFGSETADGFRRKGDGPVFSSQTRGLETLLGFDGF